MIRYHILNVLLLLSVMAPGNLKAESNFSYGGIGLDNTDFEKLYPSSLVQDGNAWLSQEDSHDHIFFLHNYKFDSRTRLRLVFEKPVKYLDKKPKTWKERHYLRFPPCQEVLEKLIAQYGKPSSENEGWEERLKNRIRTWKSKTESLSLTCYQVDGEGLELAAEINIVQ